MRAITAACHQGRAGASMSAHLNTCMPITHQFGMESVLLAVNYQRMQVVQHVYESAAVTCPMPGFWYPGSHSIPCCPHNLPHCLKCCAYAKGHSRGGAPVLQRDNAPLNLLVIEHSAGRQGAPDQERKEGPPTCSYSSAARFQDRSAIMPLRISACHASGWCHRTSSARSTAPSMPSAVGGENVHPVPRSASSARRPEQVACLNVASTTKAAQALPYGASSVQRKG